MITITLLNKQTEALIDISVNEKQPIRDTFNILASRGLKIAPVNYVKLKRNNAKINILQTYEQSNIYNGDMLVI